MNKDSVNLLNLLRNFNKNYKFLKEDFLFHNSYFKDSFHRKFYFTHLYYFNINKEYSDIHIHSYQNSIILFHKDVINIFVVIIFLLYINYLYINTIFLFSNILFNYM